MSSAPFVLDARLAADTRPVARLPLCDLRLMDDARYAWLVLVPRRDGLVEIADLSADEQATLWQEVNLAGRALRAVAPCDKLNLGALGNIVRQLHVHVVARCEGDPAWPGPVWGHGAAQAYAEAALDERREALCRALAAAA
ncbi:HIT domain-containing protein [Rhodanobacter ginsengisoli]|uniref:HIT domain-containing protein n=1 Tax=Rhodanobacter ginsengisoli TaxID=418646 RepID=A0ABW0QPP0_9GAMM